MAKGIFNKQNLFYLWLALMPFLAVSPWQILFIKPLYVGFIHYALLIVLAAWQLIDDIRNRSFKADPSIWIFGIFIIISGISMYLGWHSIEGIKLSNSTGLKAPHVYNVFTWIYLILNVASVWVVSKLILNKNEMQKALQIIIISSAIACVYGIIAIFLGLLGATSQQLYPMWPRLTATASEAQVFADFLLLGLPLAFAAFIASLSIFSSIILFIISLAMTMTFSIGAWIGLAAALVILTVQLRVHINRSHIAMLLAFFVCITMFLALCETIYPKYLRHLVPSKLYFWEVHQEAKLSTKTGKYVGKDDKLERLWMVQTGFNQFKHRPLLGVGFGNYGFLYNQTKPEGSTPKPYIAKPHNVYIEILAETGILGFLSFFLAIGIILIKGASAMMKKGNDPAAVGFYWSFAAFIGLLVHGLSFGIFAHNYTWIVMGILLAGASIYEK